MTANSTAGSLEEQFVELNGRVTSCRRCPRLVAWREEVARVKRRAFRDQVYWGKPVPGFGDVHARVMIIGLAPGAHGGNRTGRMFTGDDSGNFLFRALHRVGFANQPVAISRDDGLQLKDLYIGALCRCAPPDNKPTPTEIANCRPYLIEEFEAIKPQGIVCLGKMAYDEALRHLVKSRSGVKLPQFGHGVLIPGDISTPWVIASYHPSRQNTQTGRLTTEMFDRIWELALKQMG